MNKRSIESAMDKDLRLSQVALRRAAQRARARGALWRQGMRPVFVELVRSR